MAFVRWSATALSNLNKLDPVVRERILTKVTWFKETLAFLTHEKLHRELRNLYKLRVGNYRVIYTVDDDVISVEDVGHRRDVYK